MSSVPVQRDVKQRVRITDNQEFPLSVRKFNDSERVGEMPTSENGSGEQRLLSDHPTQEWFNAHADKSFEQYAIAAYERHCQQDFREYPEYRSPLFDFVFLLRGHRDMEPLLKQPAKAFKRVENIVVGWYRARRDKTPDNSPGAWELWFDGISRADAKTEFVDLWINMRFRVGYGPLQQAFDESKRVRCLLSDEIVEKRCIDLADRQLRVTDDYEFFVTLAGHLQVVNGNNPIMLPCEDVGRLMSVSAMTVSRWRKWAIEDGFLILTKDHQFRSKGKSEATEFRFDVSRWDALKKQSQPGTHEDFKQAVWQQSRQGSN